MAKLSSLKAAFRRKKGFSLIAVMIISLVNLAIMGVALQFAVSSSGGGRVNSAMAAKYNLLQSALEEGKARLKESMKADALPRYTDKESFDVSVHGHITSPNMLLLDEPLGNAISRDIDLRRIGIFGERGVLTVKIYDMQYKPESVAEDVEDLQSMPPAMRLKDMFDAPAENENDSGGWMTTKEPNDYAEGDSGLPEDSAVSPEDEGKAGVYLIRAALTVKDAAGEAIHTWSLETSVIQANNKTNDT